MRINLKGIKRVRRKLASGKVETYYYAWIGKGAPRLQGEPGTPDFMNSYNDAIASRKQVKPGTFFSVISNYKASSDFHLLKPRTKADYLKKIKMIEAKFGTMPVSAFKVANKNIARGVFKKWRSEQARASARQADYGWSVLGRICAFGVDSGLIDTNPCEKGGRLYKAERTEAVWTSDDEKAFYAKAPKHLHLALTLALWTGQRQGDLLTLTWSNYDGKHIRLRQGKTGKRVKIPAGEPLRAALDIAGRNKKGALILLNSQQERWTDHGFRSSWRKACASAGIAGVTFHDLRGSAVTRLAVAGATVPEIAAITGHSLKDVETILDAHYLSRDSGLADSGVAKLERHQTRTNFGKRPGKQSD